MIHKGTALIETKRLILRQFTIDDVNAAFSNWTSDEKVTEFLRWPTHETLSVTERVLKDWIAGYEKKRFLSMGNLAKGNRRTYWYYFCSRHG